MEKFKYNILIGIVTVSILVSCNQNDQSAAPSQNGIGGSMARFAIIGNYMYAVDHHDLKVFDISIPSGPEYKSTINIGWGIETIFPYNQKLFIGSQEGMYIYDITDSLEPELLSMYQHLTSCDPVVVQGDFAYVTLRSGTNCRLGANVLDILNISDPENPILLSSTGMYSPHGLAIRENNLFICEGDFGIKIFNINDPYQPEMISSQEGFHAYDVIALSNSIIVTGNDGLYQYDFQDLQELKLLSVIPVTHDLP